MTIKITPADRFAIIGKTRSGKTTTGTVLQQLLVPDGEPDWRVWWIDTKADPRDLARLYRLGFVTANKRRPLIGREPNRVVWRIRPQPGEDSQRSITEQAQAVCAAAMRRGAVLLVADEYTQITVSERNAGSDLDNVFARGGGLGVGIIGHTQEPVYIPRKLVSQATHTILHDLSYDPDIRWARRICPMYDRPPRARNPEAPAHGERHEPHGFFHSWTDGDAEWRYYPTVRAWRPVAA